MESLRISLGYAARDTLCRAFDAAQTSIKAEFHDLSDGNIIASINAAAHRGVSVELHVEANRSRYNRRTNEATNADRAISALRRKLDDRVRFVAENDPDVLLHAKAAIIDGNAAYIGTANPTKSGFDDPGEILVTSRSPRDIDAVSASIAGRSASGDYVVTGPPADAGRTPLRLHLDHLLQTNGDLRIASEDLSDPEIVSALIERRTAGYHDRVLLEDKHASKAQRMAEDQLLGAGVEVRGLTSGYMHEKFVDAGDELYVGSANLTHNGIDEAREVGVFAPAAAFGPGADAMRAGFDALWSNARPVAYA